MMRQFATFAATCAAAALGCGAALGHPMPVGGLDHAVSFASGFGHPLTGLDHTLGMVAVGLWAGLNGGRARIVWPAAFVGLMLVGGALGMAALSLPITDAAMADAGIIASVVILGLLIFGGVALPVWPGAMLVALFALLHGYAHGVEMPAQAAAASYATGFAVATAMLQAIGIALASACAGANARRALRGAGALIALAAVVLSVS
jgi:urease accessory protein